MCSNVVHEGVMPFCNGPFVVFYLKSLAVVNCVLPVVNEEYGRGATTSNAKLVS
jgi:hypothetical protein